MENPDTWTEAIKVIDQAIFEWETAYCRNPKDPTIGFNLPRHIHNRLVEAGILRKDQ